MTWKPLVVTLVLAAATADAAPAMKTVEIRDDAWGIVAFRMQIPADWTFEGAVLRDPHCDLLPAVTYRASSPDGLRGYQVLPQFGWHSSDDPQNVRIYRAGHCKIMDPMSATDFLIYVVNAIRPDPVVGPVQPTVDAAQLDAMIASYNDRMARAHLPGRETGGAVHSRLEYTLHGQRVEENLRVTVTTFESPAGGFRGPRRHAWSTIGEVSGLRAPKGQLDNLMHVIGPALVQGSYTDEWEQRSRRKMSDDTARGLAHIKAEGDRVRAQLANSHAAYMAQTQAGYARANARERERQAAVHRSAVAWTLYAGDEQLVRNPSTGAVTRTTTQYGTHGYQDQTSGDVIMSKDPSFDPSYYIRGTWTQLENVNPLQP